MRRSLLLLVLFVTISSARAHDTWLQANAGVVRVGDNVNIDLMLGNHGNDHRDFKLAGKADLAASKVEIIDPDGKRYDLKEQMIDAGYTPKEGFWTTSFAPGKPGLYTIAQTSDHVVSYAPKRTVMSAKTFFLASKSLDKVSQNNPGFDRPLGHPFEIVPLTSPVTPMGPGAKINVQLLFKGKPLSQTRVSFIPRGETLSEGFDPRYERMTDGQGRASFTPTLANYYLIVAHREEAGEKGQGYDSTKYSATMTVLVPKICPCCGE